MRMTAVHSTPGCDWPASQKFFREPNSMKQQKLVVALGAALALSMSCAAFAAQPDPNRVMVKYKAGASAQVEAALRGAGGKVHLRLDKQGVFAVTLPPQALQGLRNRPDVEYIEL